LSPSHRKPPYAPALTPISYRENAPAITAATISSHRRQTRVRGRTNRKKQKRGRKIENTEGEIGEARERKPEKK